LESEHVEGVTGGDDREVEDAEAHRLLSKGRRQMKDLFREVSTGSNLPDRCRPILYFRLFQSLVSVSTF
jgi:hypothetical protein